jgi:phenylalanyl-tRNA synthetase beta chain
MVEKCGGIMPTIEISHKDICNLVGQKIEMTKLRDEDILLAKGEVEHAFGDMIKVDIKDVNRPDLWSTEGIAREIRYRYKGGFPDYKVKRSKVVVNVDKSVKDVRPLTVCAVVRGLRLNETVLSQIIQLQEKVAVTFGRNRREVAIGVYDLDRIKSPIRYTTVGRDEIKFAPLDFEKELTPRDILLRHPKGKEFGHLLKHANRYPIFIDSDNNVLSMPPIINSNYTGRVTERTRDVFIECSGFDFRFLMPALNVLVAALHERRGRVESVLVNYGQKKITTPDLTPTVYNIDTDYVNKVSGLGLEKKQIKDLLEHSGYKIKSIGKTISVLYPAYRQDIMHPRDIVEDVIISYGFNKVEPVMQKLPTAGCVNEKELLFQRVAEILIGSCLQEILSYTLTNRTDLFDNMNIPAAQVAEIENPVSSNWSVFRNWLLPSMMDFLSKNKHVDYPQAVFEIGTCVILDEKQETRARDINKVAIALTDSSVSYEQISSIVDALLRNLNVRYKLKEYIHPSFIEGRCAEIIVEGKQLGFMGEIHPKVLNNWNLEKPVVAAEIDLDLLMVKG